MKKHVLRLMALLLSLAMVAAFVPSQAEAATAVPTEQQVYDTLMQMKKTYNSGDGWGSSTSYTWKGGLIETGVGCAAFAYKMSDAAFGDLKARSLSGFSFADVHVGDILVLGGENSDHKIIVMEKYPQYIRYAEGNYGGRIRWGALMTDTEVENCNYLLTRYPAGTFGSSANSLYIFFTASEYYELKVNNTPYPMLNTSVQAGSQITLPTGVFTNHFGQNLLGYSEDAAATTPQFKPGEKIIIKSFTILYPVWGNAEKITVDEAVDGIAVPENVDAYYYEFTPQKSGEYTFESQTNGRMKASMKLYQGSQYGANATAESYNIYDFRMTLTLKAGTTYILELTPSTTINLEKLNLPYSFTISGGYPDNPVKGDVNMDGISNIKDVSYTFHRYSTGLSFNSYHVSVGDFTNDGKVSLADVSLLFNYVNT